MVGKIKAALDARRSRETLVIARTDAVAVEGFERAIERAALLPRGRRRHAVRRGAARPARSLPRIVTALGARRAADGQHGRGRQDAAAVGAELEAIGFALVIFPGGIVRALAKTASEYYASLAAHGTTEPFRTRMLDFDGLNALIGTPEMLALGKRYEAGAPPATRRRAARR